MNSADAASDLVSSVGRHSWAWLFELARRLHVDVCIVDVNAAVVLSDPTAPLGGTLGRPEFEAAVARAASGSSPETVRTNGALVTCVALRLGGAVVGAMALVRALPPGTDAGGEPRVEVELVASWLRGSVEAHLATPPSPAPEEPRHLGALRRALNDAATGSDLSVARVFGDALAIWEDVEVRTYIEGLEGEYFLQAAPAGALSENIPAVLPPLSDAQARDLSRVSAQSLGQIRLLPTGDLLSATVESHGSRWLLLFSGSFDEGAVGRLSMYVDTLEQVLRERAAAARLRLYAAITRHMFASDDEEARVGRTVEEMRKAVDADRAALSITRSYGGHALVVGAADFFTNPRDAPHLTLTRPLPAGGTLACAVGRFEPAAPFGRGEREIVEAVLDLLEPWAVSVAGRPGGAEERRAAPRPFEQVVERAAAHAVDHGDNVAVLVIRLDEAMFRPGLTQRLAAQIRTHLRAAEPAGALTEGEIAALLFGTGPDEARAVVARLRKLAPSLDEGASLTTAAVGVAWRTGGTPYDTPLVAAARRNALDRAWASTDSARIQ